MYFFLTDIFERKEVHPPLSLSLSGFVSLGRCSQQTNDEWCLRETPEVRGSADSASVCFYKKRVWGPHFHRGTSNRVAKISQTFILKWQDKIERSFTKWHLPRNAFDTSLKFHTTMRSWAISSGRPPLHIPLRLIILICGTFCHQQWISHSKSVKCNFITANEEHVTFATLNKINGSLRHLHSHTFLWLHYEVSLIYL